MNSRRVDRVVLGISGCLFNVGGIIHWLIIFGLLQERAPALVTVYFHSLAVFSTAAGIGLLLSKGWGITIAVIICVTQIPAHLYTIYLDVSKGWNSGYAVSARVTDLILVSAFLVYIAFRKTLQNRQPD